MKIPTRSGIGSAHLFIVVGLKTLPFYIIFFYIILNSYAAKISPHSKAYSFLLQLYAFFPWCKRFQGFFY